MVFPNYQFTPYRKCYDYITGRKYFLQKGSEEDFLSWAFLSLFISRSADGTDEILTHLKKTHLKLFLPPATDLIDKNNFMVQT